VEGKIVGMYIYFVCLCNCMVLNFLRYVNFLALWNVYIFCLEVWQMLGFNFLIELCPIPQKMAKTV